MSKSAQNLSTRVLFLLLALTTIFLLLDNQVSAGEPQAVVEYVVQPGDTLWSIADGSSTSDVDVREVIADLRELNNLRTSSLQIGQRLSLPSN